MGAGEILETCVDFHGKQYPQAWLASFPPELRPAEEEETETGEIHSAGRKQ